MLDILCKWIYNSQHRQQQTNEGPADAAPPAGPKRKGRKMSKLTVVIRSGDPGEDGIYQDGEMVMSADTVKWLGFKWCAFARATDEEVERWYGILCERERKRMSEHYRKFKINR